MDKVLSCYWKVCINGKELDASRIECIEDINIEEQCDGSDTCTIKVHDPNFLYIDDNIFIEEATVSVEIGWNDTTYRVKFSGFISAIDIDFPQDGYPTLSVFCLDGSHIMNRKKNKRSWDNVTRPEVVQKIAKEYGFKCVVESGYNFTKEDTISQSDVTDISFCESLADDERVPFMCKLIGDTLYYVKKGILKDPTATLYYKKYPYDVVSFSPKINKETILEEVVVSDVDTSSKAVSVSVADGDSTVRETQGEPPRTTSSPATSRVYNPKTGTWDEIN